MSAIISRVTDVKLAKLRSDPPLLIISAEGIVPTTGWSNPELSPYYYVTPPDDGIQDFAFAAEPPDGIVIQVEQPIAAHWIGFMPAWVKGIRINSASNSIEAMFDGEKQADVCNLGTARASEHFPTELAGGEVPWPLKLMSGEIPWPL